MVASVTHTKVSTIPPTADPDLVSSDDWNDEHTVAITAADLNAAPNSVDYLVGTASGSLTSEIAVGTTPGGELGGTWASPTVDTTHSGSAHIALGSTEPGTVSTTSSGSAGAGATASKVDHSHDLGFDDATADPAAVSTASADGTATSASRKDHVHSHEVAHCAHDTVWAAKGDLLAGTANDTAAIVTAGANDTILMADSAQTAGVKWVAAGSPQAVSSAAADGTADTFSRGDHVHAHEGGHLAHDTLWAAQGDIVVATGNDAAAILSKGATGQFLQAGASTVAYADVFIEKTWSHAGACTTATGAMRWYNDTGRTLTIASARLSLGTAPTGTSGTPVTNATFVVDLNINGTTVWATQSQRACIIPGTDANTGNFTTFGTTTITNGQYFTMDIDFIGSTVAGSDMTFTVWLKG